MQGSGSRGMAYAHGHSHTGPNKFSEVNTHRIDISSVIAALRRTGRPLRKRESEGRIMDALLRMMSTESGVAQRQRPLGCSRATGSSGRG